MAVPEIVLRHDPGLAIPLLGQRIDGDTIERKSFRMPKQLNSGREDTRFVFQWNKPKGFGAAMSKEMANTTLAKLYLLEVKSPHFKPVMTNTPQFQIWKVTGNAYGNDAE